MERQANAGDMPQSCEEQGKRDKEIEGEKELVKEKEQKSQQSQEPSILEEKEKRLSNGKNKLYMPVYVTDRCCNSM